jgi:uncharacterized protein (DUF2235 family)
MPTLVSVRAAARHLHIRPATLRAAVAAGQLRGSRVGSRTIRIDLDEARRWILSHQVVAEVRPAPVADPNVARVVERALERVRS